MYCPTKTSSLSHFPFFASSHYTRYVYIEVQYIAAPVDCYHILLITTLPRTSSPFIVNMGSQKSSTQNPAPKRGTYIPRRPTDIRSPCTAINALANHGYIARSGRASEIYAAMGELGVGSMLGTFFTYPPFIELYIGVQATPPSWWSIISNPFSYALSSFAMRSPGQKDADGVACLNLDHLAKYNVVEHDISISRSDYAQGNNINPRQDLIEDLLESSSNGSTLTVADLVKTAQGKV